MRLTMIVLAAAMLAAPAMAQGYGRERSEHQQTDVSIVANCTQQHRLDRRGQRGYANSTDASRRGHTSSTDASRRGHTSDAEITGSTAAIGGHTAGRRNAGTSMIASGASIVAAPTGATTLADTAPAGPADDAPGWAPLCAKIASAGQRRARPQDDGPFTVQKPDGWFTRKSDDNP